MLRHGVALALVVVAGCVGAVAIVDHRHKHARIHRVEADNWYCEHRHARCGGPSWHRLEAQWERRERRYAVAVVALAGAAVLVTAFGRRVPRKGV